MLVPLTKVGATLGERVEREGVVLRGAHGRWVGHDIGAVVRSLGVLRLGILRAIHRDNTRVSSETRRHLWSVATGILAAVRGGSRPIIGRRF